MPPLSKADIKRLKALAKRPDSDINFSDIPEVSDEWFENALLVEPVTESGSRKWHDRVEEAMLKKAKKPISLRLDPEVYSWFRKAGPRYQSRINAVLKAYMEAHQ